MNYEGSFSICRCKQKQNFKAYILRVPLIFAYWSLQRDQDFLTSLYLFVVYKCKLPDITFPTYFTQSDSFHCADTYYKRDVTIFWKI